MPAIFFAIACVFYSSFAYCAPTVMEKFESLARSKLRTALAVKGLEPKFLKVAATSYPHQGYFQYRAVIQAQHGLQTKHYLAWVRIRFSWEFNLMTEPVVLVELTSVNPSLIDELPRVTTSDHIVRGGLKGLIAQLESHGWTVKSLLYAIVPMSSGDKAPNLVVVAKATFPSEEFRTLRSEQLMLLTVNRNTFELKDSTESASLQALEGKAFMDGACRHLFL